jgi:hypothetical protein
VLGHERQPDRAAVADDQRRQRAGRPAHVAQAVRHAQQMLGVRLPAREAEIRGGRLERGEAGGVLGMHVGERAIGPVARLGLREARVLARRQPDARSNHPGGLTRAQERAAPQ